MDSGTNPLSELLEIARFLISVDEISIIGVGNLRILSLYVDSSVFDCFDLLVFL